MLLADIRPTEAWNAMGIVGGLVLIAVAVWLVVLAVRVTGRR
ncbi:MAG TPA: hypothetical protein VLD62_10590 [Acidimicrobiia bacterium]|nr:hypothetical protein [Acidimicrobiia bacterium]